LNTIAHILHLYAAKTLRSGKAKASSSRTDKHGEEGSVYIRGYKHFMPLGFYGSQIVNMGYEQCSFGTCTSLNYFNNLNPKCEAHFVSLKL